MGLIESLSKPESSLTPGADSIAAQLGYYLSMILFVYYLERVKERVSG